MAEGRRKRQRHEPRPAFTLDKFWKKTKETIEDSSQEDGVHASEISESSDSESGCDADESSVGQSESSTVSRTESLQAPQGKAGEIDILVYTILDSVR